MARLLHKLGMLCARKPLVVIGAWVVMLVVVFGAVAKIGSLTSNDLSLPGTGSQEAKDLLQEKFPPQQNGANPIVFDITPGKLTDQQYKQAIHDSVKAIKQQPHVYSVTDPLSSAGQTAGLLSKDKQTAFAPVLMDVASSDLTEEIAQNVVDAADPAKKAGIDVQAAGNIGTTLSTEDSETSEVIGILVAMLILSLVLGSLVTMGMPILTAIVGLGAALSVVGLLGHVLSIPTSGPTLATMIGLGVGIDYALFLVTRHQEQLRDGMSMNDSIANAVATVRQRHRVRRRHRGDCAALPVRRGHPAGDRARPGLRGRCRGRRARRDHVAPGTPGPAQAPGPLGAAAERSSLRRTCPARGCGTAGRASYGDTRSRQRRLAGLPGPA